MTKPRPFYIALDFDGTVVDHRFPDIGPMAPGAIECLATLSEQPDVRILLNTVRSGVTLDQAVGWLGQQGVRLYGVNQNPDQASWSSSPKVYAHVYVDDAALGAPLRRPRDFVRPCLDWEIAGGFLERMLAAHRASY